MIRLLGALCGACVVVACAATRRELPAASDPSNPAAPSSRPAAVGRLTAEEDPLAVPPFSPALPPQSPAHAGPPPDGGREVSATPHACPMHPEVRQQGPGRCPLCKMKLAPATDAPRPTGGDAGSAGHEGHGPPPSSPQVHDPHTGEARGVVDAGVADARAHTCPMHPEVRQQGPGRCPKCKMKLVPAQPGGGR